MMATLSLYGFAWAFFLARDANTLAGEERIQIKKHGLIFGVLLGIYLVGLLAVASMPIRELATSLSYPGIFGFMMMLAVSLMAYFFWLLFAVAGEFRRANIPGIPSNGALFGYSLLYMSSLPLLQSRLNKRPNQAAQTTPGLRPSVSDL
jgi:hypothetical protein